MEEINILKGDNSSRKALGARGAMDVPGSVSCRVSNPARAAEVCVPREQYLLCIYLGHLEI